MTLTLTDYINAGYPAIVVQTVEEKRVMNDCKRIAEKTNKEYECWSLTKGHKKGEREKENQVAPMEVPNVAVRDVPKEKDGRIICIIDFHPFIKTPEVWRKLKDSFEIAKAVGITLVFISAKFDIPVELQREMIVLDFKLPKKSELSELLTDLSKSCDVAIPEKKNEIIEAALGLTYMEAENAFAMSIAKKNTFDAKVICEVKENIICNGGLLEFYPTNETLDSIGGLKNFTSWAEKRIEAYSEEAQEYGLPYPKGVLLVGIPGCGKSLTAKALANMWSKPLLKLDLGKLFGGIVGDTESNTRRALQIAEAMAPAILWIDEIEKGLSGIQSSGKTDSGVTSRMFGTLLTWLQEKEAPVFVIATANNISQLPPELLRKDRFDEIFFVDLPSTEEREEIFKIQLAKHKRNSEEFDIMQLANASEGYTGAEIEECVISSMFDSWFEGKREPKTEDIIKSMKSITPMSKGMMEQQVEALRKWSKEASVRMANGTTANQETTGTFTRKIIRGGD
ncbi:MAG: AAA family ATPase [Clostridia bacterium]|nr:AAA family ATPase [Clostridia bacterium]